MPTAGPEERTVVGVAEDATYYELGESDVAQAYVSYEQAYTPGVSFIVRTTGDAVRVTPALQAAVADIDPTLPFHSVTTLDAVLDEVLARYRVSAVLVGLFGALALLLAAAGLYGVVSYLVAQRTREIGVRIALGASRARVARQVVATGLRLSAVGIGAGLLAATLLRSSVAAMLYEVPAADPWALAGACVTLAAVAVIASVVPARRAARVDPLEAVRAE